MDAIKKNQGYGICGMKNVYSSKSLLGNWVEDNFGCDLVAMPNRTAPRDFTTEYNANHLNPSQMVRKSKVPEIKVESIESVKRKNKEGMPYSLLFGGDEVGVNGYKSTAKLSELGNTNNLQFAIPERQLERQKARKMMKERDSAFRKTTEVRALNSHQSEGNGVPAVSIGETEDLPCFNRRKPKHTMGFVEQYNANKLENVSPVPNSD